MTKSETADVMDTLRTAYPRFYSGATDTEMAKAINLWALAFEADDPALVGAAVYAYISDPNNDPYPPVISQIKRQLYRITHANVSETEAWTMVQEAERGSIAPESLPPLVLRAAGGEPGIRSIGSMDADALQVTASNFMRSYRDLIRQDMEYASLPTMVRAIMPDRPDVIQLQEDTKARDAAYIARLRREALPEGGRMIEGGKGA